MSEQQAYPVPYPVVGVDVEPYDADTSAIGSLSWTVGNAGKVVTVHTDGTPILAAPTPPTVLNTTATADLTMGYYGTAGGTEVAAPTSGSRVGMVWGWLTNTAVPP